MVGTDGPPDLSASSYSIAYVLRGGSERDDDLHVIVNAWTESLEFTIQDGTAAEWRRVVASARDAPDDIAEDLHGGVLNHQTHRVGARSVVVLVRSAD